MHEDLLGMARKAGLHHFSVGQKIESFTGDDGWLERFAQRVAIETRERLVFGSLNSWAMEARAAEREACAKVADGFVGADPIAAAIRARGEA